MKIISTPVFKDGYPRTGFVFYHSFYEALQDIPNEDKMAIVQAIIEYGLYGKEYDLQGLNKIVFTLIKPQIDANQKRFVNGQKGAEHGVKGGRPVIINPTKTSQEPQPNPSKTRKEKEKIKVKEKENVKKKTKVFIPPTPQETSEFFLSKGSNEKIAKKAFDHYDIAGWMNINGKPVKSWKQTMLTNWINSSHASAPNGKQILTDSEIFKQLGR
jgi:hypothetical protein